MAAGCSAAAFLFSVFGVFSADRAEALTVRGIPPWLEPQVTRGLSAVWNEIPAGEGRLDTLALVARRLFPGYEVAAEQRGREPAVVFNAQVLTRWKVLIAPPELRAPTNRWFSGDAAGMDGEIAALLEGLPISALSWADAALSQQIEAIAARRLPGWDLSLLARLENPAKNDGYIDSSALQVTFRPRQPLVLAVNPSIFSRTLPVMFQSDLTAKLISDMSPIIGLPVEWIAAHRNDVELMARELLEERNTVSNTRSDVEVAFVPGQVSRVDASLNSERFIFQVWMAAYAGVEELYPEAGLLAGWRIEDAREVIGLVPEIYDEVIVNMSDFGLTNRLGARLKVAKNLQAGLEVEWPGGEVWYRAWWGPARVRRPYAWWRYSPSYGHNAAFGYRINEYLSIELHYDGRYEDKIGLRGILLL